MIISLFGLPQRLCEFFTIFKGCVIRFQYLPPSRGQNKQRIIQAEFCVYQGLLCITYSLDLITGNNYAPDLI